MARYPNQRQWDLFDLYRNAPPPMTPLEFLGHWNLNYPDLARITGTSRSTVDHWFVKGASRRSPGARHCRRLAIVHFIWSNGESIPQSLLTRWEQGQ